MPQSSPSVAPREHLLAAAMLWLLVGGGLLLTTLVPMHSARLGWTPAFWLAAAPLIALLGLQPALPLRLLRGVRPSRRRSAALRWH